MRTFDSNYSDWKVGDKVVWCDKRDICPLFTITEINAGSRWTFWEDSGRRQGSQYENIVRVTESDTANMTGLEKLINDLCELPSIDLEGLEDTAAVQWEHAVRADAVFLRITDRGEDTYLDPTQALALFDYLSNIGLGKIVKHEDGTVSSTSPLHCHGSRMRQCYSIEHNEVTWL